ncbi:MAG: hypothetical protein IM638_03090 [Bacteroidetes bacterium]|nr:hypothetical protein [Bacteroidota bacterium]
MRLLIFSILLFPLVSCRDNKGTDQTANADTIVKDTVAAREILPVDSTRSVTLGYFDRYENLPKLSFQPIKETDFNALSPQHPVRNYPSKEKDSATYILTKDKNLSLRKYNSDLLNEGENGYKLTGILPSVNLFVLTHYYLNEGFTFSNLVLLDSLTNYRYILISFGDGGNEIPLASSNNGFVIYYYNSLFEAESKIGVLSINDRAKPETFLSEYASGGFSGMRIDTILWESDSAFCVKGYRGEKPANKFEYYRCVLE